MGGCQPPAGRRHSGFDPEFEIHHSKFARAFTMIEIAICLAIIGFALIAIIGVLPLGMHTQRDNREETLINQDATVLTEAVRTGARGLDYLTNFVYAITNTVTFYDTNGNPVGPSTAYGYTYNSAANNYYLTNGLRIVGMLSKPMFTDGIGGPALADTAGRAFISNHVYAYVRAISGTAADRPPQNNPTMLDSAFAYRVLVANVPVAADLSGAFGKQLAANQHELRLTFRWPLRPDGTPIDHGTSPQTFRATIAGQLLPDPANTNLYFYQPQSFTKTP